MRDKGQIFAPDSSGSRFLPAPNLLRGCSKAVSPCLWGPDAPLGGPADFGWILFYLFGAG